MIINRKGGTRIAFRNIFIWCAFLSAIWVVLVVKMVNVKRNYSDLHRRVADVERRLNER